VLGVALLVISVVRGVWRRSWCERVQRGEIAGPRLRPPASIAELGLLAAVHGSAAEGTAVTERVAGAATPYRSARVCGPIAALPRDVTTSRRHDALKYA